MKLTILPFCLAIVLTIKSVPAHELGIGDVLISPYSRNGYIETDEFFITKEYAEGNFYIIKIVRKDIEYFRPKKFQMDGGNDPIFEALNERSYCDQDIIFVTMHAYGPRYADGITGMFYTYAFQSDTLEYLADIPGPFEELTPLEDGADIGMPYFMPQRYLVTCTPATATTPFQFAFIDRAPNFRGFDDWEAGAE